MDVKTSISIKSEVIAIMAEELGMAADSIKEESKISEDLGADSLDTVELVQVLEEKFKISIPTEDVVKIKTVQDVIDYISSKKN